MKHVDIALAEVTVGEDRHLVAAWFRFVDARDEAHTRGIVNFGCGSRRESLTRITAEALRELKAPASIRVFRRPVDRKDPRPSRDAVDAFLAAADRHEVRYVVVKDGEPNAVLEAAEAFARARASTADHGVR